MHELKLKFRDKLKRKLSEFIDSQKNIDIPLYENPKVSIIVVTWNQAELTFECILSLVNNVKVPFELIIVDNASTDETKTLLSRIAGAKIVYNQENIGFLLAVNLGSKNAIGDHILLLNNDAVIRPGSLEAAVATLDSEATIGAVGGPLVLLDGTLQEAGSIIWRDGSCLGYGRGGQLNDSEYNFQRDVDYCSGAFLLIKASAWNRLGGFDESFVPAYYEETDFCMCLRASGLRVVYEPKAIVDHYEFGSAVKSEWAIDLQRNHQLVFQNKHATQLLDHYPPDLKNVTLARSRSQKKRILLIDDSVPHSNLGSGLPRSREIIQTLVKLGFDVTFLPTLDLSESWDNIRETLPASIEVILDFYRDKMIEFISSRKNYYDVIFVSRPHNVIPINDAIRATPDFLGRSRLIYDAEALFSARDIKKAALFGRPIDAKDANALMQAEADLTVYATSVVAVSKAEAEIFRQFGVENVDVLGHSLTASPGISSWSERSGILFVGRLAEEDSPNTDSMIWFCREIFPRLQQKVEGIKFMMVGRNDAPSIRKLVTENASIKATGGVPSVASFYDQARICIAPTRYAGGIPYKAHEAAAYGVPIVSTRLIANQVGWIDGVDILASDDPQGFADALFKLYVDEELWQRIRKSALDRIQTECRPENFVSSIDSIVSVAMTHQA